MTLVEFGKLISKKRREAGLSQQQLGQQIWKKATPIAAQKMISNAETGVCCKVHNIKMLCEALEINPIPEVDSAVVRRWDYWLDLTTPEADSLLIEENGVLREYLNKKISAFIEEECLKFRRALCDFK